MTKTGFAIVERVGRNNSSIEVEMLGNLSLAERVALRAQLQRLLLAHNASVRTPIALPEGLIQRMNDAGAHD